MRVSAREAFGEGESESEECKSAELRSVFEIGNSVVRLILVQLVAIDKRWPGSM